MKLTLLIALFLMVPIGCAQSRYVRPENPQNDSESVKEWNCINSGLKSVSSIKIVQNVSAENNNHVYEYSTGPFEVYVSAIVSANNIKQFTQQWGGMGTQKVFSPDERSALRKTMKDVETNVGEKCRVKNLALVSKETCSLVRCD